jgi:Flp pilus assembly protein TadG
MTDRGAGRGTRRRRLAGGARPARTEHAAGSAALELLILAPVLLLLVSLVIAAGRTALAQGSVQAAARDAARQASIARTQQQAAAEAVAVADASLAQRGLHCAPAAVRTRLGGFSAPLGAPASVTVIVTCQVPLSDLVLPGVPGSKTLSAVFSSPIDPYRGR